MIIRHNMPAVNLRNTLSTTERNQSKVLEKLSSGFRINRAADDASGLAISEKMRAQIRGLNQAQNNVQDGISLIQVAEGALSEIHGCLQRAKELSTQVANGTYVDEDRQSAQSEINALLKEIDRIADNTNFNGIKLLDGSSYSTVSAIDKQKFINWLNGSWLNDAAEKTKAVTGWALKPDASLSVTFKSVGDSAVATMSGFFLGSDLTLTINEDFMASASDYQGTNGEDGPILGGILADRLITHEMVHGLMFNNVSEIATPPEWFVEGLAESVHGASDGRFSVYESGGLTDFSAINTDIQSFDFSNSAGNKKNYTIGYLATSYLYKQVEDHSAGGFKNMMSEMHETDESFEQLVKKYTGTDYSDFILQLKTDAADAANNNFNEDFLKAKCEIDLTDGLADPLDGNDVTSSAVIDNKGSETAPAGSTTTLLIGGTNVTVNWNEAKSSQAGGIVLQIGDTAQQNLTVCIKSAKTADLGIDKLNVMTKETAGESIEICETAINTVSEMCSALGAYQNRLEHTMASLSTTLENAKSTESGIRDLDMAKEMMSYMKNNVLIQASQLLLTQINQQPTRILQLLQ